MEKIRKLNRIWIAGFIAGIFLSLANLPSLGEETQLLFKAGPIRGVDTFSTPNMIREDRVQDVSNYVFDNGRSEKRDGYVEFLDLPTEAPVRGLWTYIARDGTEWMVILASHVLYGYDGASTSTILSGLNPDARMDAVQALGDMWFTDKSTDVFYFNGTSITYVAGAPKGQLIDTYRNRIVIADVSGSQSTLYLSGELDGTDWTVATFSTSPITWRVGGVNDAGFRIKGLHSGYADFLQVFTENKTFGFFGFDRRNFQLRILFTDVGVSDDASIKEHNGILTWLSQKGIERFDRNTLQNPRVSEPIKNKIDDIIALGGSSLNWFQTSQTDFNAGTNDDTTNNISVGSVVLSTYTDTQTSGNDWNSASRVNIDTYTVPGSFMLETNDNNLVNNSFEDLFGVSWSTSGGVERSCSNAYSGSCMLDVFHSQDCSSGQYSIQVLDPDLAVLGSQTFNFSDYVISFPGQTYEQSTLSMSSHKGKIGKIQINGLVDSGGYARSENLIFSGEDITFWVNKKQVFPSGACTLLIDLLENGRSTISTGSLTGVAFNTSFSSPAWQPSGANFTANGNKLDWVTQVATSSSGAWDAEVSWSTGAAPTSEWKQYIRFKVTITTDAGMTSRATVDDVTFAARASTGSFVSQTKQVGEAITTFGNLETNETLNGGVITYSVRTASTAALLTSAPWVEVSPFTTIGASTNPFIQVRATFSITAATQNPALNDFTVNWNTGGDRPPVIAHVFKDRYHLFYATNSDVNSFNSKVAPLDKFSEWTFFDGINAASCAIWMKRFYFGDAKATGKVFQMYSGNQDAGSDIEAFFKTKDYDAGDEDAEKIFDNLYFTASHEEEEVQDIDIDISYTVDGSTESFSLGSFNLGEVVGRINAKIPFLADQSNLNIGKWLSVKVNDIGSSGKYSIFGLRAYGFVSEVEQ